MRTGQWLVLTLALLLNPGCVIVNRMSGISQTRELQKTGQSAQAVILKISDSGMTLNDDPVVWFELDVHPPTGTAFQAKAKCLISRLDIPQFQPGRMVPVRYDPADHTRVALDVYDFK